MILINTYIKAVNYVFSGSKYWWLERRIWGSIVAYYLPKTYWNWWKRFAFIWTESMDIKDIEKRLVVRHSMTIGAVENNVKSWIFHCLQRRILLCEIFWIFPTNNIISYGQMVGNFQNIKKWYDISSQRPFDIYFGETSIGSLIWYLWRCCIPNQMMTITKKLVGALFFGWDLTGSLDLTGS